MTFLLSVALLVGLIKGYCEVRDTHLGIIEGVPPSKNLIDFTFLNK
jgi:hypothetical protein